MVDAAAVDNVGGGVCGDGQICAVEADWDGGLPFRGVDGQAGLAVAAVDSVGSGEEGRHG